MIPLVSENLSVGSISSTGETFEVVDSIGFSEQAEDDGFNRESTNHLDSEGAAYPKLDEVVLVLYAYLNKYDKDPVPAAVTGQILRTSSDAVDYTNIRYSYNVAVVGDGWYTVHGFLLPVDAGAGIYYDSATGKIMKGAAEITAASLKDEVDVETAVMHTFIAPALEKELANRVGDLADLGKQKGYCHKDYKKLQQSVFFIDGQLTGARVQFEDGHRYEAQETIEDLANGDYDINS